MRDVRDILRNHFGGRFLSPSQFWEYAYNLQLVDSIPCLELLEFLERERLLGPICRVRYPPEVVRVWYASEHPAWADPDLPTETNEERVDRATNLYHAVGWWDAAPHPDRGPEFHPLDLVDPAHVEFVETDIASRPFKPWAEFEITAGQSDGQPMTSLAVHTYYRYWQAFHLAEILSMAVSTLVNFQDPQACRLACEGRLAEIARERIYDLPTSLPGWHALSEFGPHEPAFEAVALFGAYRARAILEAGKPQQGAAIKLTGTTLEEFGRMEAAIAHHAAWRWNQTEASLLEFIKWQCQRWDLGEAWPPAPVRGLRAQPQRHDLVLSAHFRSRV